MRRRIIDINMAWKVVRRSTRSALAPGAYIFELFVCGCQLAVNFEIEIHACVVVVVVVVAITFTR